MIKIIKEAQVRSEEDNRNLRETVAGIIGEVRGRGDAALKEYSEKFDGCTRESLRVSREEIDAAYKELGEQELADLKAAHHNIEAFALGSIGKCCDRLCAAQCVDLIHASQIHRYQCLGIDMVCSPHYRRAGGDTFYTRRFRRSR